MNKKEVHENDVYRPEESQRFEEYQSFPAEQFLSTEILLNRMEDFKSEEIKKVSFTGEENKKKNQKDNNQTLDTIKNTTVNTSAASVTTSVATTVATSAVVVIGAGAIGVVPIFDAKGSIAIEDFIRSEVETYIDEEGTEFNYLKNLYVYFDIEMSEDHKVKAEITNSQNAYQGVLNIDEKSARFSDIIFDKNQSSFDVEFEIYKEVGSNEETVYSVKKSIDVTSDYTLESQGIFEYQITFNDDNTSNAYFYRVNKDIEEKYSSNIKEVVQLLDLEGNVLKEYDISELQTNGNNLYSLEDIQYKEYTLANKTYYLKDSSMYMLRCNEILDVSIDNISSYYFDLSTDSRGINIKALFDIDEDIPYMVTYPNENQVEESYLGTSHAFSYSYFWLTYQEEKVTLDMTLNVSPYKSAASKTFINETLKGNKTKSFEISKELIIPQNEIDINLSRMEVYPTDSYYTTNANIFFEGEVGYNGTIQVDAINESGVLENTFTGDLLSGVTIYDLDVTQTYTFEYYVVDGEYVEIEGTRKTYQTTINNDYSGLEFNYVARNPGQIPTTFNNDNTYNAYFITNYSNETEYDIYLQVRLQGSLGGQIYHTKLNVLEVRNLIGTYGISYAPFIEDEIDPLKHYSIGQPITPSGTLGETNMWYLQDGETAYYDMSLEWSDVDENIAYIKCRSEIISDEIQFDITLDGNADNVITKEIKKEEFTLGKVNEDIEETYYYELDVSQYTFTSDMTLSTMCVVSNIDYQDEVTIKQTNSMYGKKYMNVSISTSLYK